MKEFNIRELGVEVVQLNVSILTEGALVNRSLSDQSMRALLKTLQRPLQQGDLELGAEAGTGMTSEQSNRLAVNCDRLYYHTDAFPEHRVIDRQLPDPLWFCCGWIAQRICKL